MGIPLSLESLGFTPFFRQQLLALSADEALPLVPERVAAEHRSGFVLLGAQGLRRGVLAGRLRHEATPSELPHVGDWVVCDDGGADVGRIVHRLERATVLSRREAGRTSGIQVIAANVDVVLVVCALAPVGADPHAESHGLNPRRIERYLRAAADASVRATVVVNKADLRDDAEALAETLAAEIGRPDLVLVSAATGRGFDALSARVGAGETATLVGSSGVGKSSLLNRWLGAEAQRVHEVREADTRGRHTTTHRELFPLPGGGMLIDTPGMREFGLAAAPDGEPDAAFADIADLGRLCRFPDCRHEEEPGCVVQDAVREGRLSAVRVASAQKLEREAERQRARVDPLAASRQKQASKTLARRIRAHLAQKGRKD